MKTVIRNILRILGILLLVLVLAIAALVGWSSVQSHRAAAASPAPTRDPNLLDFEVVDSPDPLEVPASKALTTTDLLMIYEASDYDLFFDVDAVTAADCRRVIAANDRIPARYKTLLNWFADSIEQHYPDADLRPLWYNLQTLEVVECSPEELLWATLDADSFGCYTRTENRIYVQADYDYVPGTWEYQVIIHEFGHAARIVTRDFDDLRLRIHTTPTEYSLVVIDEALNSLFSVSLFDYEEPDIAYQLQSNLFLILLECLDGYDAGDYLNHSIPYLAHALDVQNGNNNYAISLFKLIQAQYDDFHSEEIHRPQSVYYPIYDYVCRMYLDHYGTPDMSVQARTALAQELVERIMFDVPDDYEIDTEEFIRFAEQYEIPA